MVKTMPILASTNFVNGYGKASVVTAGALPLESLNETPDTFVVKYDTNGKALWSARIGSSGGSGTATDTGFGITTDSSGNVYVTGQCGEGVQIVFIYNSDGTAFSTTLTNLGAGTDVFIVKYNTSGFVQWVTKIASPTPTTTLNIGYAISTDSSGNVYVTGQANSGVITAYNSNGTAFGTTLNITAIDAFIVKYNTSGFVQWVAKVASTQPDIGYAIATDSDGNVYVAGQGGTGVVTTAFNSDGSSFATTIANSGGTDVFIVKYNTNGFVQWVARIASTGTDIAYAIYTDSSGNVYVTGQGGNGTVSAFSSDGSAFATTLPNAGSGDVFLVKYNTNGFVQWVARIASATGADIGFGITTDSSANVYVTGSFSGTATAFNATGTSFTPTIISSGGTDIFVAKYDTNGLVQWIAKVSSSVADIGYGIAVDSGGNVYVTGQSGADVATTAFNANGTAFGTTMSSAGSNDAFLVKYNTNGVVQWLTRLASPGQDIGRAIAIDSGGNLYITGRYTASPFSIYGSALSLFSTLPNAGGTDAFVVKYGTTGDPQWAARIASTAADIGYSVSSDSSGNSYVTGQAGTGVVTTAFNSDGSSFATTIANSGGTDAFLVKYDTNGFVQWVARLGSTGTDIAFAVATDSSGNAYITGQTGGVATAFNSDGSAFATTIPNLGGSGDIFIVKYNTNGFVQWVTRVATGGTSFTDIGQTITTDSNGNVYVAGIGASAAAFTIFNSDGTTFGNIPAGCFFVKYNSNGFAQWGVRMAVSNVFGVCTDSVGNVYVTGQGGNSVITAYNSDGTSFGTTIPNSGAGDAFIMKYNTNGFVQWVAKVGSGNIDVAYGICADPFGNVYVSGITGSTTTTSFFNSDGTVFRRPIPNTGVGYVVKYNTNGFVQWVTLVTGTTIRGYAVASDSFGNLYASYDGGTLSTTITIQNPDGTTFAVTTGGAAGIVKYNTNGFVQWFQIISGSSSATTNRGLSVDTNGNAYITGATASGQATTIYGGGNAGLFRVLTSTAAVGAYVMKQTSTGTVQWLAQINGLGTDRGYIIVSDSLGNTYVAGQGSSGSVVAAFNSDGTAFGTTIANAGLEDAFIVKYNTNGFVQWVARVASTGTDSGNAITLDSSGNVYVAGQGGSAVVTAFSSNGVAFGTTLANAGAGDAFLVKYDTNGIVQWVARVASTAADVGYGIATDSSGNVYVTGQGGSAVVTAFSSNGVAFGTTLANAGAGDTFIVKYDTSGIVQWVARVASTATDIGYGIATDSSGNVYVTGQGGSAVVTAFSSNGVAFGTTLANAGTGDAFLVKYNTSGIVQWVARVASTAADIGYSIATDSSGNVYVTGQGGTAVVTAFSSNGVAFGTTLAISGATDAFIVKYDTNGIVQWVARVASTGADIGYGLQIDSAGNVYVTGQSAADVLNVFNADGTAFGALTTKSNLSATAFVIKYNSNGVVQWAARTAGQGTEQGNGIAIDGSSNIYTTGSFNGGYLVPYNA